MNETRELSPDMELVEQAHQSRDKILTELRKVIIGQDELIDQVLTCIFAGGHALIVGVPGLAKTLLVSTLAKTLSIAFKRIQFTPDMMPSDITGTEILETDPATGEKRFAFVEGPVFTNILLADEINRTPPKTQAAMLQAMQEREVTVGQVTYPLPDPFFTIATQNPIEQEGTYPLPEAQLDRFMFKIIMDHLEVDDEMEVVRTTTGILDPQFKHTVTGPDLVAFQNLVRKVPVPDAVLRYAVDIVRTTRPNPDGSTPDFINKWVAFGASVRAAQYLILGGKARALTQGRYNVSFEDVRALCHPVLRHRILTNFHAESEGVTTAELVDQLMEAVPVPASGL